MTGGLRVSPGGRGRGLVPARARRLAGRGLPRSPGDSARRDRRLRRWRHRGRGRRRGAGDRRAPAARARAPGTTEAFVTPQSLAGPGRRRSSPRRSRRKEGREADRPHPLRRKRPTSPRPRTCKSGVGDRQGHLEGAAGKGARTSLTEEGENRAALKRGCHRRARTKLPPRPRRSARLPRRAPRRQAEASGFAEGRTARPCAETAAGTAAGNEAANASEELHRPAGAEGGEEGRAALRRGLRRLRGRRGRHGGPARPSAQTTTKQLSRSLLHRPPRQPASVKVPQAKVVNVVAGPSKGNVYYRQRLPAAGRCDQRAAAPKWNRASARSGKSRTSSAELMPAYPRKLRAVVAWPASSPSPSSLPIGAAAAAENGATDAGGKPRSRAGGKTAAGARDRSDVRPSEAASGDRRRVRDGRRIRDRNGLDRRRIEVRRRRRHRKRAARPGSDPPPEATTGQWRDDR